jgi:hypothetical protein
MGLEAVVGMLVPNHALPRIDRHGWPRDRVSGARAVSDRQRTRGAGVGKQVRVGVIVGAKALLPRDHGLDPPLAGQRDVDFVEHHRVVDGHARARWFVDVGAGDDHPIEATGHRDGRVDRRVAVAIAIAVAVAIAIAVAVAVTIAVAITITVIVTDVAVAITGVGIAIHVLRFHEIGTPTHEEIYDVARWIHERLGRVLERHGRSLDEDAPDDDAADLLAREQPVLASLRGLDRGPAAVG